MKRDRTNRSFLLWGVLAVLILLIAGGIYESKTSPRKYTLPPDEILTFVAEDGWVIEISPESRAGILLAEAWSTKFFYLLDRRSGFRLQPKVGGPIGNEYFYLSDEILFPPLKLEIRGEEPISFTFYCEDGETFLVRSSPTDEKREERGVTIFGVAFLILLLMVVLSSILLL